MKCSHCKAENDPKTLYCRACGEELNISPQHSAENLSAKHKTPGEDFNPLPTSEIGPDFSNPKSPKKVKRLRNIEHRRKMLGVVGKLTVQLGLAVATAIATAIAILWMVNRLPPPQAQTPARDGALQVSSRPADSADNPTPAQTQEAALPPASADEIAKLASEKGQLLEDVENLVGEKEQLVGDVEELKGKKKTEEQKLKQLKKEIALAEGKLKEVNGKLTIAKERLGKLNREIALADAQLKGRKERLAGNKRGRREPPRMTFAQLQRKRAEAFQLQHAIKGLEQKASQHRVRVKELNREISTLTNNPGNRNSRSSRKR